MTTARKLLIVVFAIFLAGCGSGGDAVQEEYTIDEATGLPLNPDTIPEGDFVLEGTASSMNLTPQTSPEFVITVPSGKTYRVRTQALSEIFYADGEAIGASDFQQGMKIRAVVSQIEGGAETGNTTQFVTEDLVIVR